MEDLHRSPSASMAANVYRAHEMDFTAVYLGFTVSTWAVCVLVG